MIITTTKRTFEATMLRLDPFQRATSGYHTLAHCAWTLARLGDSAVHVGTRRG
jgi:hypothetical protein